ncbi:E3 ubiquitin-protein ligase RNF14-like [Toxotes jaculatrix]|uniref:E3 ubiquitin-protein ligase RNF14-like n=1 Tax=Toxotes jaculatrix TaxID=941984 RepID=UPI001B3AFACB|nr:E3 ubiquitin-protein ligase RNF14-like [Toxotes jaculatrix]
MTVDLEEQEDELLALHSIFGSEEFARKESSPAGEIRVSVELPADFSVALREGETVRQYEISFLPPLLLTFELPEDYPSCSPPSFTLRCSWLTHTQLSALAAQLTDLYQATGGTVVLFSWVQFLKEDALRFLDIHSLLELPSDEHSTQHDSQDSQNASLSETRNNLDTPNSGSTDDQSSNVSGLSSPSLEVQHPAVNLADGQNPSTSDGSSTDSEGAVELHQNNLPSHHSRVGQNDLNSEPSHDSNEGSQASDARKAEQTFQISEFTPDSQKDLSSAAGISKRLPFAESDQIGQEDFLNEGNVSASVLLPPSSSGKLDESGQGAAPLPVHPRESFQNKEQTLSRLSLTPSQTLLSQLLIYDGAQKQKVFATSVFDCGVCFVGWLGSECVQLPECGHIFCQACLAEFCKRQITEGNVRGVTCPQADCTASPTPAQVRGLVGEELFSRYDRLLLQSTLDLMPDVAYCPRRTCGSAVIMEKSSNAALCSVCGFAFCITCRKTYHGTDDCQAKKNVEKQTEKDSPDCHVNLPQSQEGIMALWKDYTSGSKMRQRLLQSRYGHKLLQNTVADCLSEEWIGINSKNCPHCFCRIQKDGGCNMMTCSRCRQLFCWACLTRLPRVGAGSHFQDSPCSAYQWRPT